MYIKCTVYIWNVLCIQLCVCNIYLMIDMHYFLCKSIPVFIYVYKMYFVSTYIYIYIYMYIYVCVCIYIYIYIYILNVLCIHIYIYIYMCVCNIYIYIYIYTHVYIYVWVCVYLMHCVCIYIRNTHALTHLCMYNTFHRMHILNTDLNGSPGLCIDNAIMWRCNIYCHR